MRAAVLCLAVCGIAVSYVSAKVDPSGQPYCYSLNLGKMKRRGADNKYIAAGQTHASVRTYCDWARMKGVTPSASVEKTKTYFKGQMEGIKRNQHNRFKRQADAGAGSHPDKGKKKKRRVRKEIRMMSEKELKLFFEALNLAKKNKTLEPNKYDGIAEFHSGMTALSAHGGCNFHPWHRVYLLMFENALQEAGPKYDKVAIPYWDSRLESRMEGDTTKSALFSDRLMGSCDSKAVGGPFGKNGWDSPSGEITRACGLDGPLLTDAMVHNVTKQTRMREICGDDSSVHHELEGIHNGVHRYMGGQMLLLSLSPYDPIFWLHHCFIDFIWELFRKKQTDPENDYPENPAVMGEPELHALDADMGFYNMSVRDGLSNVFTEEYYRYEKPPSCSVTKRDCKSKYLKCVVDRPGRGPARRAQCVARTLDEVIEWEEEQKKPKPIPCNNATTPKPMEPIVDPPKKKLPPPEIKPVQNTFCMNGKSDIRQWVYVPVKIIVKRPPDYKRFGSYPVERGKINKKRGDIYSPSAYSNVYRHLRQGDIPATYDGCTEPDTPINTIYVQSTGTTYTGVYTEYAIIDKRLTLTVATAYIAVRKPLGLNDESVAVLHAQDSCGRVCKPICKVPGTEIFRPCSGTIKISGGKPLQFGNSFGDAVLNVWDFEQEKDCPQMTVKSMIISFYCDYKTDWIWPTIDPKTIPATTAVPPSLETKLKTVCKMGYGCVFDRPCDRNPCKHGEVMPCMKSCHMFAECFRGKFYIRKCRRNTKYVPGQGCVPGRCNYRESGLRPRGRGRGRGRRNRRMNRGR